jgi:multicomponent Na+:H+ antiporter subunit E
MQFTRDRLMTHKAFLWREALIRTALFGLLWGILIGADWQGWLFGLPVIAVAAFASLVLVPRLAWKFRPLALLHFVTYFLRNAFWGGVDVASRALDPRLPICPGMLHLKLRLPPGMARVFLADVTSLLPGTLSSSLAEDSLTIHALDVNQPVLASIGRLEELVAELFGIDLE